MADLEEAVIEKGTEVITFLREECRIPDEQCEQLEALITNTEDSKGWSPDGRELMERVEDVAKCQPYMPHDKYAEMLVMGWSAALDLMKHQRKMAFKKVRTLQEDAKCPAELMDAAYRTRDELDLGCARANIRFCEARFLVEVLRENPMPPIEELRKKVDEDWAAGTIGPPNTDGFDGEGRHVAEGAERCVNQSVAARLHAIDATPARRRGGGVSHRHPTHWSISTQARRARRTSPRASPRTSPRRAPSNTFLGLSRASERADVSFFFRSDWRAKESPGATSAGGPSPGTKPRRGRACRPSSAA